MVVYLRGGVPQGGVCPGVTVIPGLLRKRGRFLEKPPPFSPENKPLPARKPVHKGKETRYRESPRTRAP